MPRPSAQTICQRPSAAFFGHKKTSRRKFLNIKVAPANPVLSSTCTYLPFLNNFFFILPHQFTCSDYPNHFFVQDNARFALLAGIVSSFVSVSFFRTLDSNDLYPLSLCGRTLSILSISAYFEVSCFSLISNFTFQFDFNVCIFFFIEVSFRISF